jgi:hypothetical protein
MKVLVSAALMLSLLLAPHGHAALEPLVTGARSAGLGGAALALHGDLIAGITNPAGLSGLRGLSVAAWAAPSLFGIEGLNRMGCAAGLQIASVPIALSLSTMGLRSYKETSLALSAAFAPGGLWAAGFRLRMEVLSIAGYGQTAVPALDAGVSCAVLPGCTVAVLLTNIPATRIGRAGESIPQSLSIGCMWEPGPAEVSVHGRCAKEALSPLEWNLGIECLIVPDFMVRAGIATEPSLLCAGFGVRLAPILAEYGITHHWQLGETHYFSVSIDFD